MFCSERYSVIEASSKSGKTTAALIWLLEKAMQGRSGQNYWWVAPVFSQARMAFRRMKAAVPHELFEANETELWIRLANGTVLWFKGSDVPDSLYGEDVYAAVIDEGSRVKEEAFHAVRSTLTATRGPIRIIGNVRGKRNWAYKLARKAEAGSPAMHYARITAQDAVDAGVLDQAEIDDARATLPESVFTELYLAFASDDDGNPFGYDHIRRCIAPLSTDAPAVWGVDLARATDWTVCVALDARGRVCRFERWNQSTLGVRIDPKLGSSQEAYWDVTLRRVRDLVGITPTSVDSTGPGGPIDQALRADGRRNIVGFNFTTKSKQLLMEGLALAIQQRQVTYPDGLIVSELEAFEYAYSHIGVTYNAPQGEHDDCVVALALAVHELTERTAGRYQARTAAELIRGGVSMHFNPGQTRPAPQEGFDR